MARPMGTPPTFSLYKEECEECHKFTLSKLRLFEPEGKTMKFLYRCQCCGAKMSREIEMEFAGEFRFLDVEEDFGIE